MKHIILVSHINIKKRFREHNIGESISTRYRLPVKIVHLSVFPNRSKAAQFEQYLKTHSGRTSLQKRLL